MGQVRHGCATTTHAIRATIQRSQATTAALSRELGINVKTVAKWRKRETLEDRKTGPTEPSSTVLSSSEEAMIVAFWRHTLLPLDDCLRPTAVDPTSYALFTASLSTTAWDFPTAGYGRRQAQKTEVQKISHRLFPYRHCRIAHK